MKKLKIATAIIIILIVGALTNSISFPISEAQSTTNANNNTQPINQGKEIQLELTPQETITESDNLQNPSIQTALQQQQQQSPDPSSTKQTTSSNTGTQGDQNKWSYRDYSVLPKHNDIPNSMDNPDFNDSLIYWIEYDTRQ